jgi:hypothetical protein
MDWQYPHMREMVGKATPEPTELGVRRRILSYLQEDDLIWINPAAWTGEPIEGEWASPWGSAKLLFSLAEAYLRSKDERTKRRARAIFMALKGLAHWDWGKAFYPGGPAPVREGKWLTVGWCSEHSRNYPFIVEPCVRYWECAGDEEALAFARAMAEGFLAGSQPDQREMRVEPKTGAFQRHVHLHTHAAWGVAHLGTVLNEQRYLEWARLVYEFVHANGTDYGGYPEFIPQGEYRTEICVVGDMVSIGAWLARGGWPHYWDHVERTVRNELRRSQFFLTPEFVALFRRLHADEPEQVVADALRELRRLDGGFVAQSGFDDWVSYPDTIGRTGLSGNGIQMMGCCPPEGMRGLWEAWCGTVEDHPEGVYVNMAFSRDHPAARVTAYRPEDGRLQINVRKPGTYFLRVPTWADRDAVRLLRNGNDVTLEWGGPAGAYAICHGATSGEVLTLRYAVPAFTQAFVPISVPDRKALVTVHWVGNKVVEVEPHGKFLRVFRP